MAKTNIGWTDEQCQLLTWNCHKVSPGCEHCYAEALSKRRPQFSAHGDFTGAPQWLGATAMKRLMKLKAGSTCFINTMADSYHPGLSARYVHAMHNAAAYLRPDVLFLMLTKRPDRALALAPYLAWPENLWLGTSVENDDYMWRLFYLLQTPAAGHFVSAEPLLGPISLDPFLIENYHPDPTKSAAHKWVKMPGLDWVIVGGESGDDRRDFDKWWAHKIMSDCWMRDVPFFFKQGADRFPGNDRELHGRTYDERPAVFDQFATVHHWGYNHP